MMSRSLGSGVYSPDADPDEIAVAEIRELLAAAVTRLNTAGARDEALATFVPRHRRMLVTREAVLQPAGRVWRLGVLLLDRDGVLRATGSITRATEPGRPAYQSESAETRRAYRAAAQRGHFAPGETVNYDAEPIELSAAGLRDARGPLFVRNGRALVRWSPTTADTDAVDFRGYLTERVGLLADPPEGA
jgi:hypothetical protein